MRKHESPDFSRGESQWELHCTKLPSGSNCGVRVCGIELQPQYLREISWQE
jgi:hypothetical protein